MKKLFLILGALFVMFAASAQEAPPEFPPQEYPELIWDGTVVNEGDMPPVTTIDPALVQCHKGQMVESFYFYWFLSSFNNAYILNRVQYGKCWVDFYATWFPGGWN